MKNILYIILLSFISFLSFSQGNIILEVDGDWLYYTEPNCADCNSTPDPSWRNRLLVNSINYDWNEDRDDIPNCGWQNIYNYSWYEPTTIPYNSTLEMQINGYERDSWFCGADDNVCGGYQTVRTIDVTDNPPCQWNYFEDYRTCDIGTYGLEWSYYWRYALTPTLSNMTPLTQTKCEGETPENLSITSNTDSKGRALVQWYKWQISNTPNGPWSDIPGTTTSNGSSTITFTPGQISGTRYYRIVGTSNCSADFDTYTAISSVFEVTYAFPASGSYTNQSSWPFGAGDEAPHIISGACGGTVLPGQVIIFSTLQSPNAGAVVNATDITWSATGGNPTSHIGDSFSWTAPTTPGAYTITVSYEYDGCTISSRTCTVNVGAPNCDYAYVDYELGANSTTSGGPNNPYKTISYAISQLNGRNYIRVAGGGSTKTIVETSPVNIPSGIIIEGGYENTAGTWVKKSSIVTTVSCSGTESINNNVGHVVGFKSDGSSNWTLQDLKIITSNASGQTTSGRGKSNYGVLILSSTGYNIIRCDITSGNASAGANGTVGGAGNGGAGGAGGARGEQRTGCNTPGNPGSTGANGSQGTTTGAGDGGAGGNTAGTGGIGGAGDGCNIFDCNANPRPGSAGTTGGNGSVGSSYAVGNRPAAPTPTASGYYIPAAAANSGAGGGGGRGGGGGGGASRGTDCTCSFGATAHGGAGGTGGRGGGGGTGGFGGGGTFAIYASGSGSVLDVVLTSGNAGTGGAGANGGAGEAGTNGVTGQQGGDCGNASNRRGGTGGKGGTGGQGGRGQDGANGISAQMVLNGVIASPSTSIPNPTTVTIEYNNSNACRNSVIEMTKGAGNWSLPSGLNYVNDRTNSTSSYGPSSSPVEVYSTNNSQAYDITVNGGVYRSYLRINDMERDKPTISLDYTSICVGESVNAAFSENNYDQTNVDYKWEVFSGSQAIGAPLFTSSSQTPSFGAFDQAGTYTVRFSVKEQCCGWSIPTFATITVVEDPTAPNLIKNPNIVSVCDGETLSAIATGGDGGVGNCVYEYRYFTDSNGAWSAWTTTQPSFEATIGNNLIEARRNCDGSGCDISESTQVSWNVVAQPTVIVSGGDNVCENDNLTLTANVSDGSGSFTYEWYSNTTNSNSGGTLISGANSNSYVLSNNAVGTFYYYCVVTDNGTGCEEATSNVSTITVTPTANPGTIDGLDQLCEGASSVSYATNNTILGGGTTSWSSDNPSVATVTSNGIVSAVGPGTANIIYTITGGCGGDVSTSQLVQVDEKPTPPTSLTIAHNDAATNCHGREITISASGGNAPGSSDFIWGTSPGGSDIATTGSSVSLIPTESKTYYVGVSANGACAAQDGAANVTYNLPTAGNQLSGDNESATCYVEGTNPIHFYEPTTGHYIGSIEPNGRTGLVTMTSYITPANSSATLGQGDGTMYACDHPGEQFRTAYMDRSFVVTNQGSLTGSGSLHVTFPYAQDELNDLITRSSTVTTLNITDDVAGPADIVVTKFEGPGENNIPYDNCNGLVLNGPTGSLGNPTINGVNYYVTVPVSSFSEFYLHGLSNNSPLPVQLISFSASCNGETRLISWATASESNNDHFVLERSRNGEEWEEIATIDGQGNTQTTHNYSYTDNISNGVVYYQLRQIDYDGKEIIYGPISSSCGKEENSWSIHPIPVVDKATITINAKEAGEAQLVIVDNNGRRVFAKDIEIEAGTNQYEVDVSKYSRSVYMVYLLGADEYKPLKFVKF